MTSSNVKLPRTMNAKILVRAEWIFITAIFLGFIVNIFYPLWEIPKYVRFVLGSILLILSGCIMLPSWDLFKKNRTPVNPYKQTISLVTNGTYKYSRNPQYLSRAVIQVAFGILFGNIWIIIMVIPAMILVWCCVILPEERYLEQRFSNKYLQYKASTRCWI